MDGGNEDKLKEIKEAFDIYDEKGVGKIGLSELHSVLYCLGINISAKEANTLMEEFGEYIGETANITKLSDIDKYSNINQKKISFNNFIQLVNKLKKPSDEEEDIMGCFKMMDYTNQNKIFLEDMKYLMLLMGENFTDEELSELLSQADTENKGYIDYQDFVKILMIKDDIIAENPDVNAI